MIRRLTISPATILASRLILALTLALIAQALLPALPAQAEALFPPGQRVGLAPPPGMLPTNNVPGFADPDRAAAITILELPANLYSDIEKAVFSKELQQPGMTVDKRESFPFNSGIGYLISFRATVEGKINHRWILLANSAPDDLATLVTVEVSEAARSAYSDQAIRAVLASVTIRATPLNEQIGLLPFKLGELAGFRIIRAYPNRGALLTSGPRDGDESQPQVFISIAPGGPPQSGDRGSFAQRLMANTPVRNMTMVGSEPMRIRGQPGYEILAEAKAENGAALSVVQWVRFGAGGYLQIVGIARKEEWSTAFPRFRAIRDGIDTR